VITAGVDIGSSSSKAVILGDGKNYLGKAVFQVGTGTSGPSRAFEQAMKDAHVQRGDIDLVIATGYGRKNFLDAAQQLSEITCHARGVHELVPDVQTVIDIGGQDAKAIRVGPGGVVTNFVMNDKCAAGTGRFLDVMARILEIDVGQLADLAAASRHEVSISSTCTVFAESEVISQLSSGALREDVAAGIIRSVVRRVAGLAKRTGVQPEVVMTGGVSLNWMAVKYMQEELRMTVVASPDAQLTGALGAALIACDIIRKAAAARPGDVAAHS
jgi:predicted CoA-substrate-specific enzyme activase